MLCWSPIRLNQDRTVTAQLILAADERGATTVHKGPSQQRVPTQLGAARDTLYLPAASSRSLRDTLLPCCLQEVHHFHSDGASSVQLLMPPSAVALGTAQPCRPGDSDLTAWSKWSCWVFTLLLPARLPNPEFRWGKSCLGDLWRGKLCPLRATQVCWGRQRVRRPHCCMGAMVPWWLFSLVTKPDWAQAEVWCFPS